MKDKQAEQALTIQCPFCGEPAGSPCRSRKWKGKGRDAVKTHIRRILKAKGEGL